MHHRLFNNTGRNVSEIGQGCWQLGSSWGNVSDDDALASLNTSYDRGVTFFDTADVYGSGRSESLVGQFLNQRKAKAFVATKFGNMLARDFSLDNIREMAEASLTRLGVEALDLYQSHCIKVPKLKERGIFESLRKLKAEGKIKAFGASVESMDEALFCLEQDGLASLQIIFNIFRQKPIHTLFEKAKARKVALIVRLPLASGLLAGKYTRNQVFAENDHRQFNADGQKFNVGETFAGVGLAKGVELADQIKPWVPQGMTMAQMAQRWVLDFDAVTVAIPGARNAAQAADNAAVSDLPPLSESLHRKLADFYETQVQQHVRGVY